MRLILCFNLLINLLFFSFCRDIITEIFFFLLFKWYFSWKHWIWGWWNVFFLVQKNSKQHSLSLFIDIIVLQQLKAISGIELNSFEKSNWSTGQASINQSSLPAIVFWQIKAKVIFKRSIIYGLSKNFTFTSFEKL